MAKSEAYERADAILSGREVLVIKPELREKGVISVELKMCELCPRIFTREVGNHVRHCKECRSTNTAVPFKGDILRFFELRGKRTSALYRKGRKASERDRMSRVWQFGPRLVVHHRAP
jgi:hypothetical protein